MIGTFCLPAYCSLPTAYLPTAYAYCLPMPPAGSRTTGRSSPDLVAAGGVLPADIDVGIVVDLDDIDAAVGLLEVDAIVRRPSDWPP